MERLAREAVASAGVRLAWVEVKGPRSGRRVQVVIERDADRVGLQDCERVNHALSALLDIEDPFPGPYTLEVSTPGIFRPLRSLEDCHRFVGRRARVRFRDENGIRETRGILSVVESGAVQLSVPGGDQRIAWSVIEDARLDPDVDALLRRRR